MSDHAHLTPEEVEALLRFVEDYDPIVIGGQSISIWAEMFRGESQALDAISPLTSKDIDFLHNLEAEKALETALKTVNWRCHHPMTTRPKLPSSRDIWGTRR